jgi:putative oxidoreductase
MPGTSFSPAASFGLLVLRVGAGAMLIYGHGWGKLMHFSERAARFADPLHVGHERSLMLAIFAEVVCAALVAVGFATRFAAAALAVFFGIILTMVIAHDPFGDRELAYFYAFAYLCLMLTGPGAYAVDARFGPKVKFGGGK